MTVWLKQSTAVTKKMGPFLDSADADTAEISLTIQKADVRLSKNGGSMAAASADQGASDAGAAHDELGVYNISLDATDTATPGHLRVDIKKSGALPVWQDFMIVPANVWDSMFGADKLQVDAAELLTLADGIETGFTLKDVTRLMAAVLLGKASGFSTGDPAFRDLNDTTDRVVANVDTVGNRSSVTLDAS